MARELGGTIRIITGTRQLRFGFRFGFGFELRLTSTLHGAKIEPKKYCPKSLKYDAVRIRFYVTNQRYKSSIYEPASECRQGRLLPGSIHHVPDWVSRFGEELDVLITPSSHIRARYMFARKLSELGGSSSSCRYVYIDRMSWDFRFKQKKRRRENVTHGQEAHEHE